MTRENQELLSKLERKLAKDKIRFAVGTTEGSFSGIWSAWGRKNDYYIGARSVLGSLKISLHASGICRVAFAEQHFALMEQQGLDIPDDRAFVKWRRAPLQNVGAILVVRLIFPVAFLRLNRPETTRTKPIFIFETGPSQKAIELGFFYSREQQDTLQHKFIGIPIVTTHLDNGENVSIVISEIDFDPSALPPPEQMNRCGMRLLSQSAFPEADTERRGLNAIFFNKPTDNEALQIVEIGGVSVTRNK